MTARRIAPDEWRWVLIGSLAVLLFASLPVLYAWSLADASHVFSGFVYNTEDGNSYIAKMRLGASGEWLFQLPFTTESHPKAWLYSFHILLGKLGAGLGLSLRVTYHLARVILGLCLLLTIYHFIARFVRDVSTRRLAWVLIAIGSGLGWLLTALGAVQWLGDLPLDFWVPEAYVFLVLYSLPHLALAETALLWTFLWLLEAFATGKAKYALLSGVSTLVVTIIVPFYPAVLGTVLGFYLLMLALQQRRIPWREAGLTVLAGLFAVPVVAYTFWLTSTEPVYSTWSNQLHILSPHPLHYLLGYAPLLVPAVWGLKELINGKRKKDNEPSISQTWFLPFAWLLAAPVLAYLPFISQRRLIVLAQVPLSMLAAVGLRTWFGEKFWAYGAYVMTASLSILFLVLGSLEPITQREVPVYRPGAEVAAMVWLDAHAEAGQAVLASLEVGKAIPAWTDLRAFAGHGPETLYSGNKQEMIYRFFGSQADDAWRQSLLHDFGVDYVFHGPQEKAMGDWDPAFVDFLIPIYEEGGYAIYQAPGLERP